MKKRGKSAMIKILIYVILSVSGLTLLKVGTSHDFMFGVAKGVFEIKLNIYFILGMLLYVLSFIASLIAMKSMDLSIYYPVSAGIAYVMVCIVSFFVLKEVIVVKQWIGIFLILVGIMVMNM